MKNSFFFLTFFFSTWLAGSSLPAQTLNGSFENKFKRYVAHAPFSGEIATEWEAEAWKGEQITRQIVLWTSGQLADLTLSATDLTGSAGRIPASAVSFRYGLYVKGDLLSKECGEYANRREYQQLTDAWSTDAVTTLSGSDPLKLWVVIRVPHDTPGGNYTGKVIATGGSNRVELTVHLYVADLELPDVNQWSFHLDLWQYPNRIAEFYNSTHPETPVELWSDRHFALLEPFYRELADCGQKAISAQIKENALGIPSMVKWIRKTDGEWTYDFTAFDRYVSTLMEWGIDRQINCFSPIGWNEDEIPYYDESSGANQFLQAVPGSELYKERWDHFLTHFKTHLDAKGWFGKTVLYFDEISEEKALPVIDEVILPNHSEWKIGGTITREFNSATKEKFYDLSAVLGRTIAKPANDDKLFTFYTSCSQLFPNSFVTRENTTAEMTWMAWHAASQDYNGYLRWAYDNWQLDDPADVRDGSNTAGDFSIVYRSSNTDPVRCYPSLRLMMLREGIQDFEKIRILKALFQRTDPGKSEILTTLLQSFTLASGENDAEATVQEGQRQLASLSRTVSIGTGTEKIKAGSGKIRILHNPASPILHLQLPEGQTVSSVRFYRLSGAEVNVLPAGEEGSIRSYSLEGLSPGIYAVQILTEKGTSGAIFLIR